MSELHPRPELGLFAVPPIAYLALVVLVQVVQRFLARPGRWTPARVRRVVR